ncbi:MAG: LuxR family transcriptional regulator [Rhizobium sp.]|nr:LuxR family transcriptional regulator [Rhizobium sp.]
MDADGVSDGGSRDLLIRIQTAQNLSEIGAAIDLLLRRFSFRYFKLFSSRASPTDTLRDQILLSNVPVSFFEGFDQIGGLPPAPVRILQAADRLAWQWHVSVLKERAALSPQVGRLMVLLREHGMSRGIYAAVPTLDGRRQIFGVYGEREELSPPDLDEFSFLSIHLLDRMEALEKRQNWQRTGISSLEIECLEMAAAGLDTAAIAQRLSLSARTVNYLVASLCRKLGADRLEHALGEAIKLGYLN